MLEKIYKPAFWALTMKKSTGKPGLVLRKKNHRIANPWASLATIFLLTATALHGLAQPAAASDRISPSARLENADSLFGTRQYTQALDLYVSLREQNVWSPSMLLKMAYIEEALGRLGESLYYLNLYYLASHDPQALGKMEELADKKHLEGYREDSFAPLRTTLREYYLQIAGLLAAISLLITVLMLNRARLHKKPSVVLTGVVVILLATLYVHANYSRPFNRAMIIRAGTYLMDGPSSASSVVEIVGEGHCVSILSQQDIWLKIKWRNQEAYVRKFLVRNIEL